MGNVQKIINKQFLRNIENMRDAGWSETAIANKNGLSVSQLRVAIALIKEEIHKDKKEN